MKNHPWGQNGNIEFGITMMAHSKLFLSVVATLSIFAHSWAQDSTSATHRLELRSGGEIVGKLLHDDEPLYINKRLHIRFETESGGVLQLDKNRLVSKIVNLQDTASTVYQDVYAKADDIESHKAAVEWCAAQKSGKTKYRNEINYHLRQILKLDPNDSKAWSGIRSLVTGSQLYRKRDGEWVNDIERFKAAGYARVDGKWQSQEALRLIEQLDSGNQRGAINDSVKKWKKLLRTKPEQARSALSQVIGPGTVVPLFNFARGEKKDKSDRQPLAVREMVMESIATVDSRQSLAALVYFAVEDPNRALRDRAVTLLENERMFSPELVVQKVIASNYLGAQNNNTIQNAAYLLDRIGSVSAIVPLISALQTKHIRATGERPGGLNTVARGGRIEGFKAGGDKTHEEYWLFNPKVHQALRSLSGDTQDFAYDKAAWKAWYISTFKHIEMDVRGDDDE